MIYTISLDFLENIEEGEEHYYTSILFQLANEMNPFKVAVDKNKEILDIYRNVKTNPEIISTWLDHMSYSPFPAFELIPVDLSTEINIDNKFMILCSAIKGNRQMIVYSIQNVHLDVDCNNCVEFQGKQIKLLDKDEARIRLNQNNVVYNNYNNSQVAGGDMTGAINRS